MSVNDTSRIVVDDSRVTLKIVALLSDSCRSVIYDHMFMVQATEHKIGEDSLKQS